MPRRQILPAQSERRHKYVGGHSHWSEKFGTACQLVHRDLSFCLRQPKSISIFFWPKSAILLEDCDNGQGERGVARVACAHERVEIGAQAHAGHCASESAAKLGHCTCHSASIFGRRRVGLFSRCASHTQSNYRIVKHLPSIVHRRDNRVCARRCSFYFFSQRPCNSLKNPTQLRQCVCLFVTCAVQSGLVRSSKRPRGSFLRCQSLR